MMSTMIAAIEHFRSIPSVLGAFDYKVSEPWHFNDSRPMPVPFGEESGVYFFAQPDNENWNVAASENQNPVWYVGMSKSSIGKRVWNHVGLIYDPETKEICTPRFRYHRWRTAISYDQALRDRVADGDIVIYSIAVPKAYAAPLEKYLLIEHFLQTGKLPALNGSF